MLNLTQRLERGDADIGYARLGVGPPTVVLTHGAGLDHSMFDLLAPALARTGVLVIVWDVRGHGCSPMRPGTTFTAEDALGDLGALLDACAVDQAILIGHSLGGNLVQEFARRDPDRVAGLIVLDSAWNTGPLSTLERFGLRLAAPSLGVIPQRMLPGVMARASATTSEAVKRTKAVFARTGKPRFLEVWRATTTLIQPDPTYRSPVPIALIRGAEDRTGNIAREMAKWAAAEGVVEHVVPCAGHVVTWDAPAEVQRIVLDTLEAWGCLAPADGAHE